MLLVLLLLLPLVLFDFRFVVVFALVGVVFGLEGNGPVFFKCHGGGDGGGKKGGGTAELADETAAGGYLHDPVVFRKIGRRGQERKRAA